VIRRIAYLPDIMLSEEQILIAGHR
jgi:hypothetical protein